MIQRAERSIQARVVIKNRLRAVNISRRAYFGRDTGEVDLFAIEMPVAIAERMHVVAAFVPNAETKISGAWHKRLHNFSIGYPISLRPIFRIAISPTPIEKLVSTSLFPCLSISPRTACAAR